MDWQKDSVLMRIGDRSTFAIMISALVFAGAFIIGYRYDICQQRLLRRIEALEWLTNVNPAWSSPGAAR